MPNRNGVGNSGRSLARGGGRGVAGQGRRPLGSNVCTCPKCGYQEPHNQRGVLCTQVKCPKCKSLMRGEFC